MTSTAEATALAYLDAVAKKDMERCASLLDPEIRFVGPANTTVGARELIPQFQRIGVVHVRTDIKRVFSDGGEVCVIYDFVTDAAGALPCVEWIRVAEGKIKQVNLFYDQVPWLALREEIARRLAKTSS